MPADRVILTVTEAAEVAETTSAEVRPSHSFVVDRMRSSSVRSRETGTRQSSSRVSEPVSWWLRRVQLVKGFWVK